VGNLHSLRLLLQSYKDFVRAEESDSASCPQVGRKRKLHRLD